MKAAILHEFGQAPRYEDYPDPVPASGDQLLLTVKAASVKNLDKGRASGTHYARYEKLPEVVGIDGVGVLEDGTRVYGTGITGMIAEKALISKDRYTVIPDNIDDVTAAALPNAILGAALALRYRAEIKAGDTVLINGATGVTGQTAIQLARYYGAKKVIATGRNQASLNLLLTIGADELVSLKEEEPQVTRQIRDIHGRSPIDIVIDYTWGRPAELILDALKGGGLHQVARTVRFVTVGSMAGEHIQLSSGLLRSSAIDIMGSGFGSLPREAMERLPWESSRICSGLAGEGRLKIGTITAPLKDIETVWHGHIPAGKRLVIVV